MTAIAGVLCADGLVIGTDSSCTFASGTIRTIEQPIEKLTVIGDSVIVAGTGQVGLGQRFNHVVAKAFEAKAFANTPHHIDVGKRLCQEGIADFQVTSAPKGQFAALVGFALGGKPYLCEFAVADFQPEFKDQKMWYVSLGSGQLITDPFLALMREVFWKTGPPTVQEAIFAVTWALDHAVQVNPGGINAPVRIAVMERVEKGKLYSRILEEEELLEHRQNIEQGKDRLRDLATSQKPDAQTPDVPKPDP
jgi:20S proteasome alpha/beta subunit